MWGEQDPLIPVRHGVLAHERIAGSRLEVFPGAGHFPHLDDPQRFAETLLDFVRSTAPAPVDRRRLRSRLRTGPRPAASA